MRKLQVGFWFFDGSQRPQLAKDPRQEAYEETLVTVAVDLSGRNYVVFQAPMPSAKIGEFDSELVEDFWYSFASNAKCNYHTLLHYGRNTHHIAEAIFKASARALRIATTPASPHVLSFR